MKEIFQAIGLLIGFLSILFLAYVTTRLIAGKSNSQMAGKYITVLDTMSLGTDKRLYLIKVGNKYSLIASSGKGVDFLTDIELDEDEIEISTEKVTNTFSFSHLLDRTTKSYMNIKKENPTVNRNDKNKFQSQDTLLKKNLGKIRDIVNSAEKKEVEDEGDFTNEK